MNLAEKLAGTYLRLNGFLTLPHFTAFDGNQHNHVDLVALRAPKSQEVVGDITLITDDLLFDAISAIIGRSSRSVALAVVAEVRTSTDRDEPSEAHINYVGRFLGDIPVTRLAFYEGSQSVVQDGQTLDIGMRYAGLWIQRRIDWMNEHEFKLTKAGSWNLSEDFLSDFLALRRYGLLTNDRPPL
jgi:hypothetical protein